jgi:hypothetical protein
MSVKTHGILCWPGAMYEDLVIDALFAYVPCLCLLAVAPDLIWLREVGERIHSIICRLRTSGTAGPLAQIKCRASTTRAAARPGLPRIIRVKIT